ncbi:MAG: Ig-like domain-containing protein [Treponema sp.]
MKHSKFIVFFGILAVLSACKQNGDGHENLKTPSIEKIIVQDKTISINATNEKITATVIPSTANQSVTWVSEDTTIVVIDASTGLLTPKRAGKVKVIATSTVDSTKKGEATITISSLNTFEVALSQDSIYFGGTSATLTITPNPAIAQDEFVVTSENTDLEITKATGNTFTIAVKNEKAKEAKVILKVKPKTTLAFQEKTQEIEIKTIVPESISIKGEDKMYVSEELQFNAIVTPNSSIINKNIKWEVDSSYAEGNKIPNFHFEITEGGKLKIIDNPNPNTNYYHGKTVRIKAVSLVDDNIVATKVITVYNNVADVKIINLSVREWVHCKEINNSVYNGSNKLTVKVEFEDGQDIYKKVLISEKSYFNGSTSLDSAYLKETIYDIEESSYAKLITKNYTEGQEKTFYVFPIDPKTERPSNKVAKRFKLTIWAEPEAIEFLKGNSGSFDISKKDDGSYYTTESLATGNHSFYVRLLPFGATKQEWLSYKLEDASKRIKNDTKGSSSADGQEYTFDINAGSSGIKEARFNFMVKVANKEPNPKVINYLKIKY